MTTNRYIQIARLILLLNLAFVGIGFVSNLVSFVDRLLNGMAPIPGLDLTSFDMWKIHTNSIFGLIQLLACVCVYYFGAKLLRHISEEGKFTELATNWLDKLIKALSVLTIIRVAALFVAPNSYMPTLWENLMNSMFVQRSFENLDTIVMFTSLIFKVASFTSYLTIFISPVNGLLFILLLIGLKGYLKENKGLKTELDAVI